MWNPIKPYQFDRREHQPYYDTQRGVIIDITTPTNPTTRCSTLRTTHE